MKIVNVSESKHLTQVERKSIVAILKAGLMEGKVNRKSYFITVIEKGYKVIIKENRSNDYGKIFERSYSVNFEIK